MNWGEFRERLRRSILRDASSNNWDDTHLLDLFKLALDTFAQHTAAVSSVVLTGVSSTTFSLPDNLMDNIEEAGAVYLTTSTGTRTYLPCYTHPDAADRIYYRSWDQGTLTLSEAPGSTYSSIVVEYFAYYPEPEDDEDELLVPRWAINALMHLTGAICMTMHANSAAMIDQWNDKIDSGNPNQNPLREQQRQMFAIYTQELARRPRQERQSFYDRNLSAWSRR